jgi:hypothetical protein
VRGVSCGVHPVWVRDTAVERGGLVRLLLTTQEPVQLAKTPWSVRVEWARCADRRDGAQLTRAVAGDQREVDGSPDP